MELLEELRLARLKKPAASGKVAFLQNLEQISAALNEGYTAMDVWRLMHKRGEINVKYNQFAIYVRKFVRRAGDEK
ncbi:hypothetical protein KEM63_01805 [Halopseudomonas nanhaiensis]|uniref:TraK family protein n=1 Tax=Halopseudomonas nanhaiensis TaxID=2830842 RepID=UPI001CBCF80E|nr:TraK family protein [Halopseudomonas nanhaiensis]UAW98746.1 hypothetical protein KEM63_01805 [Halopseudomonas nanhaiensis]